MPGYPRVLHRFVSGRPPGHTGSESRATGAIAAGELLRAGLTAAVLLLFAAPILAAGGPVPRAPMAFTVLSSATPHFLVSGSDPSRVTITIRNDGSADWDAGSGYALSYHWRTPFDRLVQRDGTRTPIVHTVVPGREVTLDAELGLPPRAGLYVLEWDMVQENVAWFSERDKAPLARTLVLVLPDPVIVRRVLPALPVVVAALGLLFLVRRERHAPGADGLAPRPSRLALLARRALPVWDLAWCAASLFAKQVTLLSGAHLQVTATGVLMSALTSLAPVLLLFAGIRGPGRPRAAWLVAAAGSLLLLGDVVYYRYFGDVLSVAALSAASQAGQLGASIRYLLQPEDTWLMVDLLVALPFVWRLGAASWPRISWRPRAVAAAALAVGLACAVPSPVSVALGRKPGGTLFRHLNVVQDVGVFAYHLDDGVRYVRTNLLRPRLTEQEVTEVRGWFADHARERAGTGPYFGAARGRNIVLILAESLQGFVVGLSVNGQEVTPHLNRLRAESLWSSRVVDQAGEGRTSDAELVNAVSLLPISHGAAAFQYPANHFVALPQLLASRGYRTFSAVPFDGSFWNRSVTHAAYGFSHSFFASDFQPGEQVGWGLNDRSFLRQMVPRLRSLPRPFCTWLITLSLHHPFDSFPDSFKSLDLGRWNGTRLGNYLHAMHLFDQGLGDFIEGLRANGLLDDTLLVVEGDHEAGAPWEEVAPAAGFHRDRLDWYLADRVALVVRVPGPNAPRGELKMVAGQADIAPTLLALLGVDPGPLPFSGRNLLGNPGADPVVRRYGDWIDSRHLFLAGQGYTSRQACFDLASRREVPLGECGAGQAAVAAQVQVSHRVLTYGLQQSLLPQGRVAIR